MAGEQAAAAQAQVQAAVGAGTGHGGARREATRRRRRTRRENARRQKQRDAMSGDVVITPVPEATDANGSNTTSGNTTSSTPNATTSTPAVREVFTHSPYSDLELYAATDPAYDAWLANHATGGDVCNGGAVAYYSACDAAAGYCGRWMAERPAEVGYPECPPACCCGTGPHAPWPFAY